MGMKLAMRSVWTAVVYFWLTVNAAAQIDQTPPLSPPQGLENPSLGMGLNGISDWSTQHPFVDVMKTARPWIGHLPGQWGGVDAVMLAKQGVFDAFGWPKIIPETVTQLETFILTDQPENMLSLTGRYRLTYVGSGKLRLSGRAQNVQTRPGEIWFDYKPGGGPVGIILSQTDPAKTGDYIRDIAVTHENNIPLFEVGVLFNPLWIQHVEDLRLVRFMDWMLTNGSTIETWEQRPRVSDFSYGWRGVPVEIMVALANQIGADPWFNMPHMANDAYVRSFASYVKETLSPDLKAHVEYSNEMWNFIFPQTKWAQTKAHERWGENAPKDAWMQFSGMRAAETADIWFDVFGASAPSRLSRIISTHTGWQGLEESLLTAPLWIAEDPDFKTPPKDHFDAYGITGYFGYEAGSDELAPLILEWIIESREQAKSQAGVLKLEGEVLQSYLDAAQYSLADQRLANWIEQHSLAEILNKTWPYHANIAYKNDLELIMYEGGSHAAGSGVWMNNLDLTLYLEHFNYTQEMAKLYAGLLAGWRASGGTLFNAFVDVAAPSKFGSWGALRHLDDENPRYQALRVYNNQPGVFLKDRAADAFVNGQFRRGTEGADQLGGTKKADILLGLAGDDVLRASGGGDRLHGGPGHDIAVLNGQVDDYVFHKEGALLIADGPNGKTYMFSIETLRFIP